MKKILLIFNICLFCFVTGCKKAPPITEEIALPENPLMEDIVLGERDKTNHIFINVLSEKELLLPNKLECEFITWIYSSDFFKNEGNILTPIKNGTTTIKAILLNNPQASKEFQVSIKNFNIESSFQHGLTFYYYFLKDSKKIGQKQTPSMIVFHNTANTAKALNEVKYLASKENTSSTSFHFAVDDTGVYQAIPTNYVSYHAGNLSINQKSIGIEIALSKTSDINKKDKAIQNSIQLISLLMYAYDINIDNVITHQDASGKFCPHDIIERYGLPLFYENLANSITENVFI